MGALASQITSLTTVNSTVYRGADQRRHQSSASLAFVQGIHRWPVNSPHKWPVTRKMFPFDFLHFPWPTRWVDDTPTSHLGHYLVDPYTWPWSPNGHGHGHERPTATPFVQCQSALRFWDTAISKFDHKNPWSRSCVWSKVKVTFDLQNSKVKFMVKVKPIGHIWGLGFNRYVCFSLRGNRTTFGWGMGNSIVDLENSRSRSWPRSYPMVTFEP